MSMRLAFHHGFRVSWTKAHENQIGISQHVVIWSGKDHFARTWLGWHSIQTCFHQRYCPETLTWSDGWWGALWWKCFIFTDIHVSYNLTKPLFWCMVSSGLWFTLLTNYYQASYPVNKTGAVMKGRRRVWKHRSTVHGNRIQSYKGMLILQNYSLSC